MKKKMNVDKMNENLKLFHRFVRKKEISVIKN